MEFFPLLELPEEIQAVVQSGVGFAISSMFYPFPGDSICLLRLSLMKRAADAGYERAVYTHAMTRAIFEGEGKYFDGILFESVDRIGKLVRSVKWAWGLWHGDYFRDHKVLFICFLCHRSTDANVQILCSDNVTACGTLMSLRMITCVTAVSGSKSSACSYVILNR
ncbi:unnamed protein product [Brassica rapa subsp. trilocularis]